MELFSVLKKKKYIEYHLKKSKLGLVKNSVGNALINCIILKSGPLF